MSRGKGSFFDVGQPEVVSLSAIEEIGPIYWNKIRQSFPSLSAFLRTPQRHLVGFLPDRQIGAIQDRPKAKPLSPGIKLLTLESPDYPPLLREIPDPPLWLYVVGDPATLSSESVSIVGSRKHSTYAKEAIDRLILPQFAEKVTIVSGLAYGIDKLAHQVSLAAGGKTIAVLAGGLDKIYPTSHQQMAKTIIQQGGALVSEYPPGSQAYGYRFPIRNRIIAGLSRATIVVEAAKKSGTMTTARSAIDYNRELFAVPGDITRSTSEGCNLLIHQGATPLIEPEQLALFYGLEIEEGGFDHESHSLVNLHSPANGSASVEGLLKRQSAMTIDQLAKQTGLSVEDILRQLTVLELSGKITQEKPGYFKTS